MIAVLAAVVSVEAQQIVCHRGMWNEPGSSQNSIRSLVKADSIGAWGSELDVWLTKDGVLVVNHDPTIGGVEIQHANYSDIQKMKLSNGESLPTLEQMLRAASSLRVNVVIELKKHTDKNGKVDQGREKNAVKKIIEMVHDNGLDSRVSYISFSSHAIKLFAKQAPNGTPVLFLDGKRGKDAPNGDPTFLLESEMSLDVLKQSGVNGIDYRYEILTKMPYLIDEAHKRGMKVNVWTVDKPEEIRWCIAHGVDYITTNDPVTTRFYIDAKQ